jgi:hypothetical protein
MRRSAARRSPSHRFPPGWRSAGSGNWPPGGHRTPGRTSVQPRSGAAACADHSGSPPSGPAQYRAAGADGQRAHERCSRRWRAVRCSGMFHGTSRPERWVRLAREARRTTGCVVRRCQGMTRPSGRRCHSAGDDCCCEQHRAAAARSRPRGRSPRPASFRCRTGMGTRAIRLRPALLGSYVRSSLPRYCAWTDSGRRRSVGDGGDGCPSLGTGLYRQPVPTVSAERSM